MRATSALFAGMPFNQSMGIPVELTLRTTEEGLRLFANPVRELASLRTKSYSLKSQIFGPGENPAAAIKGELDNIAHRRFLALSRRFSGLEIGNPHAFRGYRQAVDSSATVITPGATP